MPSFLAPIDLNKNELRNARVQNLASAPSSPVAGQLYWDTAASPPALYVYSGSAWQICSLGTGVVTSTSILDGTIVNADINASAAIALSKLATDPLARAGHTGTQLAATISDFDAAARTAVGALSGGTLNQVFAKASSTSYDMKWLGLAGVAVSGSASDLSSGTLNAARTPALNTITAPAASLSMNSQAITNLLDPTNAQDAATKNYVDNAVAGLAWKDAARVKSTANVTVSNPGTAVFDGVTLSAGDRILLASQTAGAENGVYAFVASGSAMTRTTDADSQSDLLGMAIYVQEGTAGAGTAWVLTTDATITVGTTALTFAQFAGGSSYSAGNGLGLASTTFSVTADTGISVSGSGVKVDHATVPYRYATLIGDGASTALTVTHNLGTRDVVVAVYDAASYAVVEADVANTTTNTVTITFAVAPASNAYRAVVLG